MILKPFFIILIILPFTGCASSPIDFSNGESLPKDEGLVCGRVKVIEENDEIKLSSLLGESKFGLTILPDNSSKAMFVPLKDDGTFIWHLPPGNYTIASFEWRSYGTREGQVFAGFQVFKNETNYIGTLTIFFSRSRYTIQIIDEYEALYITLMDRLRNKGEKVFRNLMQKEERR